MRPERPCENVRARSSLKRKNKGNDCATLVQRKSRRIELKFECKKEKTSDEGGKESPIYERFVKNVEKELDQIIANEDDDDYCVSTKTLTRLSRDVAKLRESGDVYHFGSTKKTIFIDAVMQSVDAAKRISLASNCDDDDIHEVINDILVAAEASLLVCNLYASSKKSKPAPNDNMRKIVKFVQLQMRETIFPAVDPFFSLEQSGKQKKCKSKGSDERGIERIYRKLVQIIDVCMTLFAQFSFNDSIVFEMSAVSVKSFFVDNIGDMQDACLRLVTTIFRQNPNSRNRIFSNILTTIDRTAHSTLNPRPYKLQSKGGRIQMVTALVLQLLQYSIDLPDYLSDIDKHKVVRGTNNCTKFDLEIMETWETTIGFGERFLRKFFGKCKSPLVDTDFESALTLKSLPEWSVSPKTRPNQSVIRQLFENFVNDLLTTMNLPEWPAAELLLNQLATMLVKSMVDENTEHSMRVLALKYLGLIVAGMSKNAITLRYQNRIINELISEIRWQERKAGEKDDVGIAFSFEEEKIDFARGILLDFLAVRGRDTVVKHARDFYWAQFFNDLMLHKQRTKGSESLNDGSYSLEERKQYLLSKLSPVAQDQKIRISSDVVHFVVQYLAGHQDLAKRYRDYLPQILQMLIKPSAEIQAQVMRCLTWTAENDLSFLKRKEIAEGLMQFFLNCSNSVRKTVMDLIGKSVIKRPGLINHYYEMLSMGIADTAVLVQTRAIQIFRDICIKYPNYYRIPEMFVALTKPGHHEDARVRKWVARVFAQTWFTPCARNCQASIDNKINQMIEVIGMTHDTGLEWIWMTCAKQEKPMIESCQQITDRLVQKLTMVGALEGEKALPLLKLLHLLAKMHPNLLVDHAATLESYLFFGQKSQNKMELVGCVAGLLEQVVPLERLSETLLANLQGHLLRLMMTENRDVAQSLVSCSSTVTSTCTSNYSLIRKICSKYIRAVIDIRARLETSPDTPLEEGSQMMLHHALNKLGLLFRFFDFKQADVYGEDHEEAELPSTTRNDVFEHLLQFASLTVHEETRQEALLALGHFCITNSEFLMNQELLSVYHDALTSTKCDPNIKIIVLGNVAMYLDAVGVPEKSNRIIHLYLNEILNGFLHANEDVRSNSLTVVERILRPEFDDLIPKIVPFLICLSTDECLKNANWANHHLENIDRQNLLESTVRGMQLSLELQTILRIDDDTQIRGFTMKEGNDKPIALNGVLYASVRQCKDYREMLIDSIIEQFDERRSTSQQMLYLADNLAYFPYEQRDEQIYVANKISSWIRDSSTQPECDDVSQPLEILLDLQQHLEAMYDISDDDD